jgi:hypothetical protein
MLLKSLVSTNVEHMICLEKSNLIFLYELVKFYAHFKVDGLFGTCHFLCSIVIEEKLKIYVAQHVIFCNYHAYRM